MRHDVCVLTVPELRERSAERLRSSELAVGQAVSALGYGTSFRLSVTEGRITALYQLDNAYVVRTSAVFPRGASGGGLFDEQGHLVGILTFRASIDDQLNYAVPIEWVERLLEEDSTQRPPQASSSLAFWEDRCRFANLPAHCVARIRSDWRALEVVAIDWALIEADNGEAWLALGRAKAELDQHRQAVLALRRAVALEPNNSRAWFWLAFAYRSIGFYSDFIEASTHLELLDPQLAGRLLTTAQSDVQHH